MRFWQIFLRSLKETYRDPLALGFLLAFPLMFMLLFGFAFSGDTVPSYNIGVIDNDGSQASQGYISDALGEVTIFEISSFNDTTDAMHELKLGEINAYIVIPQGFGVQALQIMQGGEGNLVLDITYDESDLMVSEQIISSINTTTRIFAGIEIPITINANPINIETEITNIDFISPGIIIFGLLIMIPTSGRIMLRDKESRFLYRMLTTPARPWEFITGYSLSMVLLATVQIFTFRIDGDRLIDRTFADGGFCHSGCNAGRVVVEKGPIIQYALAIIQKFVTTARKR